MYHQELIQSLNKLLVLSDSILTIIGHLQNHPNCNVGSPEIEVVHVWRVHARARVCVILLY